MTATYPTEVYKAPAFQIYKELKDMDPKSDRFKMILDHVKYNVEFADTLKEYFDDEWDKALENWQASKEAFDAGECTSEEVQAKEDYYDKVSDAQSEVEDFFLSYYRSIGQI
jgi:hypothetical protein